jgi:hypothetical protein
MFVIGGLQTDEVTNTLTHEVLRALTNRSYKLGIFRNIAKASAYVSHSILVRKLGYNGKKINANKWLT